MFLFFMLKTSTNVIKRNKKQEIRIEKMAAFKKNPIKHSFA